MSRTAPFYVYILFRLNGIPCYVGKGKGDRWNDHERYANHKNKHLGAIISNAKMLGETLPKVKVRENMNEAEAFDLERLLIGLIGRGNDGPLANQTDGGDGISGHVASAETRAKISLKLTGKPKSPEHIANNPGHGGKTHSAKAIVQIKEARARQPRHISPETQFKFGQEAWNKGISGLQHSPATQFKPGHVMSAETCAKLSKSVKESWARRKAVRQSSIDEGAKS